MAGSSPVELALEAAALGRPVAQEDAGLGGEALLVPHRQVDGGQLLADLGALDGELDGAAPLLARQRQRAGQHVEQPLVVGRDLRLRLGHEALPQLAEVDLRGVLAVVARAGDAEAQRRGQRRDEARRLLLRRRGRLVAALLLAHARLGQLQDAPRREARELLVELRTEIERWDRRAGRCRRRAPGAWR